MAGLCDGAFSLRWFQFLPDPLVHLLAMDRGILRCFDPNPDLVAGDVQDSYLDVVTDHQSLTDSPRQYQHDPFSLLCEISEHSTGC